MCLQLKKVPFYRMNLSWNEGAALCANLSAHLPFYKGYAYETFPHLEEAHGYMTAMLMKIFTGKQKFGDITFVGLHRKVFICLLS